MGEEEEGREVWITTGGDCGMILTTMNKRIFESDFVTVKPDVLLSRTHSAMLLHNVSCKLSQGKKCLLSVLTCTCIQNLAYG